MYGDIFVDELRLDKGIYITSRPTLHEIDTTIENMISIGKRYTDLTGNQYLSDKYFENLEKCRLVEFELKKT